MAEMDGHGRTETKASDDVEMEEGKDGGTVVGSATFVVRELGKSFSQPFLGAKETFLITKVMPCVCYKDKDRCESVTVKLVKDCFPTAIMVEHMQKHHKKEWTEVHTAQTQPKQ